MHASVRARGVGTGSADHGVRVCALGSVCLVCMCACVQAQYEMVFAEFKDAGIANALPPNAPAFSAPVAD